MKDTQYKDYTGLTIQQLASHFESFFKTGARTVSGTKYLYLADDAPERLKELVKAAHEDFMPDDYKYQFICEALDHIANSNENDDMAEINIESDIYTNELYSWLASHLSRAEYVNAILSDQGHCGHLDNIATVLGDAQQREKQDVFNIVWSSLEDILTETETDNV
jgi:hypothetical protein